MTTLIIVVPVTVSLVDILGVSAFPFLLSEMLLSNIGGVATLIGDPPNILIGSAAGLGFLDFIIHLAPIAVLAWILAQGLLLIAFRRALSEVPSNAEQLMRMDERRAIVDPLAARHMLVTLGITLSLFFVHELIGVEPGLIALVGACIGVLWLRPDFDQILHDIHWDVLLFFIALFVVAGGLASSGVVQILGDGIAALSRHGLATTALAFLWGGALASGIIGSIPLTIALLPLVKSLAGQGIDVTPLWWALAIGVGFGANLTPLGAASNITLASLFDSLEHKLTLRRWAKSGTWIALATCGLGTLAVLVSMQLGWFG